MVDLNTCTKLEVFIMPLNVDVYVTAINGLVARSDRGSFSSFGTGIGCARRSFFILKF